MFNQSLSKGYTATLGKVRFLLEGGRGGEGWAGVF